jgi:LCP family protein required for cell wall assembly
MQPQRPRRTSKRPHMPWDFFSKSDQRQLPTRQPDADRTFTLTRPTYSNPPQRQNQPGSQPPGPTQPSYPGRPRQQTHSVPPPVYRQIPPRPTAPNSYYRSPLRPPAPRRRSCCSLGGCLFSLLLLGALAVIAWAYLLWPGRTNILLLGIDYADWWNWLSRTDTIMLTTWIPADKYIGILSVPRDLWVNIPGVGENRINTAHFFCEANQPGSGPDCTIQTIQANFGVPFTYYVRVRFEGFKDVVNALDGVDITLTEPMAGYDAGKYHLTGNKALAFVRARYDSDDFHRMEHGQFMLKAIIKTMLKPQKWLRIPAVIQAVLRNLDTNLPRWLWPRYAFTLLRVGPDQIDNRVINGDMATPFFTNQGADVLAPNWDLIRPVVREMFGR